MRNARLFLTLTLLVLPACPRGDDPGRTEERPPPERFPTTGPSRADRIANYVRLLEGGRTGDVAWATRQLAAVGPDALAALDLAMREKRAGNEGFVLNALDAVKAIASPLASGILLRWLHDPASIVRERAVEALGAGGGNEAAAALMEALEDDEPRVVARTINALGTLKAPGAAEAILAKKERLGPSLRLHAIGALMTLGGEEARRWLEELAASSDDPGTKRAAAAALGLGWGDDSAIRALARTAPDLPSWEWASLVELILDRRLPEGASLLAEGLESTDPGTRREARALAMAHPVSGRADILIAALTSEDEAEARWATARSARWIAAGNPEVTEAMVSRLAPEHPVVIRVSASNALVESGVEQQLRRVADELRDRPGEEVGQGSFSFGAGRALTRGGDRGIAILVELLRAEKPETVLGALAGLAAKGDAPVGREILPLLRRPEKAVRLDAARALAITGSAADLTALEAAFRRERDPEVKTALTASARRILSSANGGEAELR